jgi:hypothetical protein
MLLAGVTQHARFILSGPFVWALALIKPNTSGFTQGAPSIPLHILHHAGSFFASNEICWSQRCVASCELLGLHGQEHGKIRLGTMLHELSVLFHTGLFFKCKICQKGKVKNEKLGNEVI